MRLVYPEYLYLLWVIPILVIFYIVVFHNKYKALNRFGNIDILKKLMDTTSVGRQRFKIVLIITGVILMIVALSRPQIGTKMEMVKRKGIDIVFAIDTSESMNAEDVKPNRLEKAKGEIIGFIDKLEGDRIGLVAFAGKAFIQCPLTLDYGAVRIFLDSVNTKIIPVPGTAIGEAIRCAIGAFNQKERKYKALILLTDGEDHGTQPIKAAEEAKKHGIRIYTIGIGSPEGEPIPIRGATGAIIGYKRDAKGNIVMSKLDEITLEKIALITNGKYYRATPGEIELDKIYKEICKMEKKELFTRKFTQYEDRFQIFLVIALFVLCLECVISDRKRIKKVWRGRFV